MPFDTHGNFGYSTVATAPSPATSGTSLVVASGQGTNFSAVTFNAVIWPVGTRPTKANAEIVRVTNIATDTFTITRAQESSSARTVVVGDQIAEVVTKKSLTDIEAVALGGTVTSVAMTVPTGLTVGGSPIATSGTLAVTEDNQSANIVKSGPSSGGAATPTYRALVKADQVSTTVYNDQANTYSTGAQSLTSASSLLVPASAGYAPTANGSLGFDTTQVGFSVGGAGALNGKLIRQLSSQQPAADSLTAAGTNTVETAFATTFTIPANFFIAGKRLVGCYNFTKTATATIPTSLITLRVQKSGPTNVNLLTTTAAALSSGTRTFQIWFSISGTAAAGTSVNVVSGWNVGADYGSYANNVNTTAQPVAISTDTQQTLQLTIKWGTNAATNSMQLLDLWVAEGP